MIVCVFVVCVCMCSCVHMHALIYVFEPRSKKRKSHIGDKSTAVLHLTASGDKGEAYVLDLSSKFMSSILGHDRFSARSSLVQNSLMSLGRILCF